MMAMIPDAAKLSTYRAWCVFTDDGEWKKTMPFLRLLREGYRHCFVVAHDGTDWITMDSMAGFTEITVHRHLDKDYDLPGWLAECPGSVVIAARMQRLYKPAPPGFFTCVEACKRFLGIHHAFIVTPYQLYRYLKEDNFEKQEVRENRFFNGRGGKEIRAGDCAV